MPQQSFRWKSPVLVAVQLVTAAWLALSGPVIARPPLWLTVELVGLALALWAIGTVGIHRVRIMPEAGKDARLVTNGPYRWVRHPMYAAVLLSTLALVLNHSTLARALVWLVLAADLRLKLHWEESLLLRQFPEYEAYRRRTKRLVPFVY